MESDITLSEEFSLESFADTTNVVIKEEPIEIPIAEIEAARINVENLSFINHQLSFKFHCNNCQFESVDRPLFEDHLTMHSGLEWTGFCSTCDAHVIGYDANLVEEYHHMLKVHVKQSDFIDLNDEINTVQLRPLLKLKSLEEILSKKNF